MQNYNETTNEQEGQNNLAQEPAQEENNYGTEPVGDKDGSMFKIGSIIIILAIVVFGGMYLWGAVADNDKDDAINAEDAALLEQLDSVLPETEDAGSAIDEAIKDVKDTVADQLGTQSSSDDLGDIEADLNASDLGDINLDDLGF